MKSRKNSIDQLNRELQRSTTLSVLHSNAIANRVGLTATEFETADIVRNRQPITAGELAKACGVTSGAITGIVDRLERKGHVCRRRDERDRRCVLIEWVADRRRSKKLQALYAPISTAFLETVDTLPIEQIDLIAYYHADLNDRVETIISELHHK